MLLAIIPFVKIYLTDPARGMGIEVTGNTISAASDQYMTFLLKKEELFNYFMTHYDKGFFKFQDEENYLYSTLITLESLRDLENLDELSPTAQNQIIKTSKQFYDDNKNSNWFSPTYTYSFYAINHILKSDEFSEDLKAELAENALRFKINKSIFRSLSDAGKPELEETLHAIELLDGIGYDITDIKRDVIGYINVERVYGEEDSYYISRIAESIGEKSEIPRTTIIGCVIKQYIPFVDSANCAKLLKEKNVLTYFPSAFLLVASYFMLTYRGHRYSHRFNHGGHHDKHH